MPQNCFHRSQTVHGKWLTPVSGPVLWVHRFYKYSKATGHRWIQGLNVFTAALKCSVFVTTGFKLSIMQRSLIREVFQVSGPRLHIRPSLQPPAMLTWSYGLSRLMLISPHHTWLLNQALEIWGCHQAWVCFRLYCQSQWPGLKGPVWERGIIHSLRAGVWSRQFASVSAPPRGG